MKWLKNMSTKELAEAYERVTNEEDLHEFENHCQNIGVQLFKAIKEQSDKGIKDERFIANQARYDIRFSKALIEFVNHSLKMMDK